jgi:hypothetical protein
MSKNICLLRIPKVTKAGTQKEGFYERDLVV